MNFFNTNDQRYEVECQLYWMYRTTYEIEMHINAVISLNKLFSENSLNSDLCEKMIFYHNEMALIRAAYILKNKTGKDEKHSLKCLKNYLEGMKLKTKCHSIKDIFDQINLFYITHQVDIDDLIKKRDAEAHEFKQDIQLEISINNSVSLNIQLDIILEARNIISRLYVLLFNRAFPSDLEYPIDLYSKIYINSIEIIASNV